MAAVSFCMNAYWFAALAGQDEEYQGYEDDEEFDGYEAQQPILTIVEIDNDNDQQPGEVADEHRGEVPAVLNFSVDLFESASFCIIPVSDNGYRGVLYH